MTAPTSALTNVCMAYCPLGDAPTLTLKVLVVTLEIVRYPVTFVGLNLPDQLAQDKYGELHIILSACKCGELSTSFFDHHFGNRFGMVIVKLPFDDV